MPMKQEWENLRIAWKAEYAQVTQKKMAEIMECDTSYISKLGNGKNQFNEKILEKFSEHLNLPLSEIFAGKNISEREKEHMVKLHEMIEAMKLNPELKSALYVEYLKLKNLFAAESMEKKTILMKHFP